MIRLEDVSRSYAIGGGSIAALASVTEHVRTGEYVAIMGPSGSGKSTLLNVIGCLDRPTTGRYWLDGREVGGLSEDELTLVRRHTIGFIFQFFHLVPRLSALENVELPMVFADVARGERRSRAADALAAVGLADRVTHRPDQLSGGERQRVAIARATIMRPQLLLADEPTGNLDSVSGAQVLEMLDRLHAGGLTLLVVTHDPQVARRAQRTLVMADGHVVRRLTSEQMRGAAPSWGTAASS